ncbi:MAG: hypothetical protein IPM16_20900 [Chloroflexi bacterium]|nr:hypothetical protein [Chloroflexota bacterium]
MTDSGEALAVSQNPNAVWIYGQPGQPVSRHPFTGKLLPFPIHRFRTTVLLMLFVSGLVPLLVALNWRRLGYNGRAIAVLIFMYVGLTFASLWLYYNIRDANTYLVVTLALGLLVNSGLILSQRRAYLEWRTTIPAEPSFWRIGCFVYPLISAVVIWVSVFAGLNVVQRIQLSNTTRFESGRVAFEHPAIWTVNSSPLACGIQPGILCVAAVTSASAQVTVYGIRSERPFGLMDDVAEQLWTAARRDYPVWVELDSVSSDQIGGYEARLYSGTVSGTRGGFRMGEQIRSAYIRTRTNELLLVSAYSTRDSAGAVEALIRSIEIETPEDVDDSA